MADLIILEALEALHKAKDKLSLKRFEPTSHTESGRDV